MPSASTLDPETSVVSGWPSTTGFCTRSALRVHEAAWRRTWAARHTSRRSAAGIIATAIAGARAYQEFSSAAESPGRVSTPVADTIVAGSSRVAKSASDTTIARTHARVGSGIAAQDSHAARAARDDHMVLCQVWPQPPMTLARCRQATRPTMRLTTSSAWVCDMPASGRGRRPPSRRKVDTPSASIDSRRMASVESLCAAESIGRASSAGAWAGVFHHVVRPYFTDDRSRSAAWGPSCPVGSPPPRAPVVGATTAGAGTALT